MIVSAREKYNSHFSEETYQQFIIACAQRFNKKIEFKICETPVFIPRELTDQLIEAGRLILEEICSDEFVKQSHKAIPQHLIVPGDEGKPVFIALDFGVCDDGDGNIIPKLIEMQGFASLYCWQHELANNYRSFFEIPGELNHLFNGLNNSTYIELLKNTILGDYKPEEVILLEVEPEKQKTWIDFYLTREALAIEPVCISDIIKEGRDLFYLKNGIKTQIKRIYNRLIFDELENKKDLKISWNLTEDANVEWVCHPNWFFRISKYTLPFIRNKYVPETYFVNELESIPEDIENWVLKPLFSFAGHGVIFNVEKSDIEKIFPQGENFILQKKVKYIPVIKTPDEPAKCEIRLMYIWEPGKKMPELVINLVRLSKGVMIGVDYNKNKSWVGGTVGYFE